MSKRYERGSALLITILIVVVIIALLLVGILVSGQQAQQSAQSIGSQSQASQSIDRLNQSVNALVADLNTLINEDDDDDVSCDTIRLKYRDIEAKIESAFILGGLQGTGTKHIMKEGMKKIKDKIDELCEEE